MIVVFEQYIDVLSCPTKTWLTVPSFLCLNLLVICVRNIVLMIACVRSNADFVKSFISWHSAFYHFHSVNCIHM